jgi:hypothetical protein
MVHVAEVIRTRDGYGGSSSVEGRLHLFRNERDNEIAISESKAICILGLPSEIEPDTFLNMIEPFASEIRSFVFLGGQSRLEHSFHLQNIDEPPADHSLPNECKELEYISDRCTSNLIRDWKRTKIALVSFLSEV